MMEYPGLKETLKKLNSKKTYHMLQLQMLLLQAKLLEVLKPSSFNNISEEEIVDLLEQHMAIYKKISMLDSSAINSLFTKQEVLDIDLRYTQLMQELSSNQQKPKAQA